MKISERKTSGFEEVLEFLEIVENNLIVESERNHTFNQKRNSFEMTKEKYVNNTWCSICKNNTHTTKQCTNSNKEKPKVTEKNCLMFEKRVQMLELKVDGKIKEEDVKILIDTGAARNFISRRLVHELGLEEIEVEEIVILTANSEKMVLKHGVCLQLRINDFRKAFMVELYVLDDCVEDVILGNDFIFNQGMVLDFNRRSLRIQDEEIGILGEDLRDNELDRMFYEKLGFLKENDNGKNLVIKTIEKYKENNDSYTHFKMQPVSLKTNTQNIEIKRRRGYHVTAKFVERAKMELKRLCDEGIIVESDSKCISPAFLIVKKTLDLRLVIDYRELNEYIIDEYYDIPKIIENLMLMGANEYFTTIDLKNGFNQIPLDRESQELTGFMLMNKTYRYRRVPFGIRSGPKLFQKTISRFLEGIENCFVYIDDIVIYSKTLEEHNKTVIEVLERLKKFEVRINFDKCQFYCKDIKLLGYFISQRGIRADPKYFENKTLDIIPKTKKQVQKVIGIVNWYRRFIPKISERMHSITELLKLEKFKWSEEQTHIVEEIKDEIKKGAVLRFPDFKKKFILETDASNIGIGAVLYQEHGVIGYYSKKLNDTEKNYSIVEKELYAILKSLDFFRDIIQGFQIDIYTDSKNCLYAANNFNSRIERWKVMLNDFNFNIKGIKGTENVIADTLSRIVVLQEDRISDMKKDFVEKINDFMIEDTSLEESQEKIKIQNEREEDFLRYVHEVSGHAGVITNYYNLKDFFNIRNLMLKIKKINKDCEICKKFKHYNVNKSNKCSIEAEAPFTNLSSDIFGPFSIEDYIHEEEGRNGYFITITDVYTRLTKVKFVTNIMAEELVKTLKEWIIKYGKPKAIIMDNGTQYTSGIFKDFLVQACIEGRYIPKYTPSANGISERINIAIAEVLRINKYKSIQEIVKKIHHKVNENYNIALRCAPTALVTGTNFYDPRSIRRAITRTIVADEEQRKNDILIGKKVYLKNMLGGKLDEQFLGPFEVIKCGRKGNWVQLENEEWVHVKNIKL
jgi:hypothetical protein